MEKVKVSNIIDEFMKDYPKLFEAGAEVKGVFGQKDDENSEGNFNIAICIGFEENEMVNPFNCHLSLWVSFFTDHRKIPKYYKGMRVLAIVRDDTEPEELKFDDGTQDSYSLEEINLPQRYIDCVINRPDEIRNKLGDQSLTFQEMLDALCWGDFEKYKREYERDFLK